jgi:lincosamide nucleotidyltransferase A/C/D/E
MMTGHDVLRVLDALHVNGVSPVIQGGWGVDALLGRQTRLHKFVDLIVDEKEQDDILSALDALGYDQIEYVSRGRTELSQPDGRKISLHLLDERFVQHTNEWRFEFPEQSLQGRGLIVGRPVRCLSADGHVLVQADRDLTDTVQADLFLLADQLGARLFYPLARGTELICRTAERTDIPAMAAIMADARRAHPLPHIDETKTLKSDTYARYWQHRMEMEDTTVVVISIGEAIVATIAISPWQGTDLPPSTTAALYGLAKHSDPAVAHLDGIILQRAGTFARQRGFLDLRSWVLEDDRETRAVFEQAGWQTDGKRNEIVSGLTQIRYVAR